MKKVIIVTPLHPANKFNGACQRINKVINTIKSLGNDVTVVYTCQDIEVRDKSKKENIERNLLKEFNKAYVLPSKIKIDNQGQINKLDDFYPADIEEEYLNLVEKIQPNTILVNYVFLSKLLEVPPNKNFEKIIDTHDKLSRAHIYESVGLDVGFFCTTEEEELRGLKRADKVICIQDNETKYFKENGIESTYTIGHLIKKQYLTPKGFKIPKKIGFLGSNHIFNAKSIESFLQHPKFIQVKDKFEFVFAGGICENPVVKNSKVTLLGRVEQEEDFYNKIDIVINPVTIGTGLKIKTIDSLSFGLPVIGTKTAFDGIKTPSEFHSAEDMDSIFSLLERVINDPATTVKLSNLSKNIFENYYQGVTNAYKKLFLSNEKKINKKITINHIVNFTESRIESDLYIAQPITMFSFDKAKKYSTSTDEQLEIKHHIVKVKGEDIGIKYLQDYQEHEISRTIKDEKGFDSFKPLPMLADILSTVDNVDESEYIAFTNADISLTPAFYTYTAKKIREGYDALVINRRTVSKYYSSVDEYDEIISDYGASHPGFDCFIFKASALRKMYFAKTLVGVHLIGRVLLWNIFKFANRPLIIKEKHLTFHIGDDNAGKDEQNQALLVHNYEQAVDVLSYIYDNKLEENINSQAPDALKIFYKPNIIRTLSDKKKTIFLHSMFRTGSSYLWSKFDQNSNVRCYYEPFHETLNGLTLESIEKSEGETGKFHARLGSKNYWSNYKSELNPTKGVKFYDKAFAYSNYTDNSDSRAQVSYIQNLIESAKNKNLRPIFQFNRSALRQQWFKVEFPQAINFYILREPLSQFNSFYESYLNSNRKGFLRTQLAYIDHNLHSECYQRLKHFIDMPNLNLNRNAAIHNYFSEYDKAITNFNEKQLFFIFFWDWVVSVLHALNNETPLINMSHIGESLVYRRKIESKLIKEYIYIDFDDCSVPKTISNALNDSEYLVIIKTITSQFYNELLPHCEKLSEHGLKEFAEVIFNSNQIIDKKTFSHLLGTKSYSHIEIERKCLTPEDNLDINPVGIGEYDIVIKNTNFNIGKNIYGLFEADSNAPFIDVVVNKKSIKTINGKPFPLLTISNFNNSGVTKKTLTVRVRLDRKTAIKKVFIK